MFVYLTWKCENGKSTLLFRLGTLGSIENVKHRNNVTYQLQKHLPVPSSVAYAIKKGSNTDLHSHQVNGSVFYHNIN